MNNKYLVIICIFWIFSTTSAHAYLDPGTGSIILQAILAFIAAIGASISFYWSKFKFILKKILKKTPKDTEDLNE